MKKSKKNKAPRLYDFRIKYSSEDSVMTNYHYYNCESAEQALEFQKEMIEHKNWDIELISIERKNPYSDDWEDFSEVINSTEVHCDE
tara:strand:+ start:654 stop:914 length:261 start_codon:yes stop_codon:yes gene_type:complete